REVVGIGEVDDDRVPARRARLLGQPGHGIAVDHGDARVGERSPVQVAQRREPLGTVGDRLVEIDERDALDVAMLEQLADRQAVWSRAGGSSSRRSSDVLQRPTAAVTTPKASAMRTSPSRGTGTTGKSTDAKSAPR